MAKRFNPPLTAKFRLNIDFFLRGASLKRACANLYPFCNSVLLLSSYIPTSKSCGLGLDRSRFSSEDICPFWHHFPQLIPPATERELLGPFLGLQGIFFLRNQIAISVFQILAGVSIFYYHIFCADFHIRPDTKKGYFWSCDFGSQ